MTRLLLEEKLKAKIREFDREAVDDASFRGDGDYNYAFDMREILEEALKLCRSS